ncbi:MAG: aldo/keto reductase [Planctomycetaceae bacterium]|nr:aldo/keto reductase [Planctomycetaceae bacterium]
MTDIKRNDAGIPIRPLGKTGVDVSILGVGGGHLSRPTLTPDQSIELVHRAIDGGLSFFDNAWEYWEGESERRMGLALKGRRDKAVLMTKVCGRDRKTCEEHLNESLKRLQTDVIDVWQFHEINYDNDPDLLFAPGGGIEAMDAAVKAGKVRFVGFTGHKSPHIFQKMLSYDYNWDTVQLPISVLDYHYRSFQNEILPELNRRDIGVIAMKSLGGNGQLVSEAGLSVEECRRYVMSMPVSTLVAGMQSFENLEQDLEIVRNFSPMTEDEKTAFREQVADISGDGRHEWYKSTQFFDSAYHRDQHSFPPVGTVR